MNKLSHQIRIRLFFNFLAISFLLGLAGLTSNLFGQSKTGEVFRKVSPSVVLIRTNEGGGSGFLVSSDGFILTALHVVDGASQVSIKTQSGKVYSDVSMFAKDQNSDVALLKINGSGFSFANL
ncbi:MAG: serine protease [Chloracidobacterium sp.]|nr:serine protease [Chloracidobacterium sp.]